MTKNYPISLICLIFGIAFSNPIAAQITAGNDFEEIPFGLTPVMVISNVLSNDMVNGAPATFDNVTITPIASDDPYIGIESDGSVWYTPTAMVSPTVHIAYYRITSVTNPLNYDIGSVVLNVGGCLGSDINISNSVNPTCGTQGSITLTDLPSDGSYWLKMWRNGTVVSTTSETGTSHTFTGLMPGIYHFSVTNSVYCVSLPVRQMLVSPCYLQLSYVGTYNDFNSDGVVDAGDVVNYQFSLTNGMNIPLDGVTVDGATSQIIFTGEPISTLAPGESDNSTYSGLRILTQADINNGYVSDRVDWFATNNTGFVPGLIMGSKYAEMTLGLSDGIRLNAFEDNNGNGIQDNGEPNFSQGTFEYQMNNDGTIHHVSTQNGSLYLYESNSLNSYNLNYNVNDAAFYNATATYTNVTVTEGAGITTYSFPVTVTPHDNLEISLSPSGTPRPGFTYGNIIYYTNAGTAPMSGTVVFTKAGGLSITNITNPGAVVTANGFTADFVNLLPHEIRSIIVTMQVPAIPAVALGDLLTNSVSVTLPANDINPANNSATLTQTISGSYDPNSKTEHHGGEILTSQFTSEDFLTYTIQFENTGTASAVNIKLADILDSKLDGNSIRMVSSSHDYVLDRVGNHLNWTFSAINLEPFAEGSETGHGFVTFQVKPLPGYAVGDIIPNTADIYFDFNPEIATNTCTTEFVSPLESQQFNKGQVVVYPNPSTDIVNFSLPDNKIINSIILTDVLGKTIVTEMPNKNQASVSISELASGVYFARIKTGENVFSVRLIKK